MTDEQQSTFLATAKKIVEPHTHETRAVGHTECDACLDADASAIASIVSVQNDAATAMRSACVEKVKGIENQVNEAKDALATAATAQQWALSTLDPKTLEFVITALEAVTLDQQQGKQS